MAGVFIVRGLPFVAATIYVNGQALPLARVLVDTGSATCIFKTDDLKTLGVNIEDSDNIRGIRGVGGREWVVEKRVDAIEVDSDLRVGVFTIQIGSLAYGLPIDAILGMDFLLASKAILDLDVLTLSKRRV
jgi:hypothetical protein